MKNKSDLVSWLADFQNAMIREKSSFGIEINISESYKKYFLLHNRLGVARTVLCDWMFIRSDLRAASFRRCEFYDVARASRSA